MQAKLATESDDALTAAYMAGSASKDDEIRSLRAENEALSVRIDAEVDTYERVAAENERLRAELKRRDDLFGDEEDGHFKCIQECELLREENEQQLDHNEKLRVALRFVSAENRRLRKALEKIGVNKNVPPDVNAVVWMMEQLERDRCIARAALDGGKEGR